MTNPNDDMLDGLFAQARKTTAAPSDDLTARVLADADAMQPQSTAVATPQMGLWARMLDTLGGWPAVGSLATATVVGIWVGVAPPSSVEDMTANLLGDQVSVTLFSTDLLFEEEVLFDG
ncbi:hypothetical protein RCCS2_14359 [Roseobacter sp. CCS2]|nr:hypothetical protein RCCS2_14359 [Roseobacter sp. CCS2]